MSLLMILFANQVIIFGFQLLIVFLHLQIIRLGFRVWSVFFVLHFQVLIGRAFLLRAFALTRVTYRAARR